MTDWIKSSKSSPSGNCAWLAHDGKGAILIRDEHGNTCQFDVDEIDALFEGVKYGDFDRLVQRARWLANTEINLADLADLTADRVSVIPDPRHDPGA